MLTLNRPCKLMPVDLACPAMVCKLANWRGADRGMSWPGLIEGGSLFGGDVPRLFVVGVRELGFWIHLPSRRRVGSPLRAVGALGT
jgi:hypothetical protein